MGARPLEMSCEQLFDFAPNAIIEPPHLSTRFSVFRADHVTDRYKRFNGESLACSAVIVLVLGGSCVSKMPMSPIESHDASWLNL